MFCSVPQRGVATRLVAAVVAASLLLGGCGAVRRLPQYIGKEDGTITKLIEAAAAAAAKDKGLIQDAAEAAGSKIHGATVDLLGEQGSEQAKSAFTELACQTIAGYTLTGRWPTTVDTETAAFNAVRAEVQSPFKVATIGTSVISVAQSMWTGNQTDEEAVRNVVCAAVGVRF